MANDKKQKIFGYILDCIKKNGYSPSIREICQKFNFASPRSGQKYLEALEEEGLLERSGQSRGIKIISAAGSAVGNMASTIYNAVNDTINLPILGRIAAGVPLALVEQTGETETLAVPRNLVGRKPCYVLQVKGDSMIDDHIMNGDFIVIEEGKTAENGQVVVALINNNEATLKRFYREPNRIRLQPANSTMKPIYVKDVAVQGVVRGLFRKF